MGYSDRYLLFIEYFNREKFMSAQTTLDEIWIDETGTEKNFYGGLIQLAVSLYHLTNENPKGAKVIFAAARGMLEPYGPSHFGVSLKKLIDEFQTLFDRNVKYDDLKADYRGLLPKIDFTQS